MPFTRWWLSAINARADAKFAENIARKYFVGDHSRFRSKLLDWRCFCLNSFCKLVSTSFILFQENETSPAFQNYAAGPNLKLRLRWTNNPDSDEVPTDLTIPEVDGSETKLNNCCSNKENNDPGTYYVCSTCLVSKYWEYFFCILYDKKSILCSYLQIPTVY